MESQYRFKAIRTRISEWYGFIHYTNDEYYAGDAVGVQNPLADLTEVTELMRGHTADYAWGIYYGMLRSYDGLV